MHTDICLWKPKEWFTYKYCYENGNGVFNMIGKSAKNKNNGFVYMIDE